MSFNKKLENKVFLVGSKAKKGSNLSSLAKFAGVSSVLFSMGLQSVSVCAVRICGVDVGFDKTRKAYYIVSQKGNRVFYPTFWEFIKALFSAIFGESEGQPPAGNEEKEKDAGLSEDNSLIQTVNAGDEKVSVTGLPENGSVPKKISGKSENDIKNVEKKAVDPELEKKIKAEVDFEFEGERKKLEEDRSFLVSQKNDKEYKICGNESHEGETDLIREFHFNVMCVLASRVISLRYEEISKKIDDFKKEVSRKFDGFSDIFLLYDNKETLYKNKFTESALFALRDKVSGESSSFSTSLKVLADDFTYVSNTFLLIRNVEIMFNDACKACNFKYEERESYREKLNDILVGKSGDLSEFKKCFKDDKEFEIFKQKVEFCCSDKFKEMIKLEEEKIYYERFKNQRDCCFLSDVKEEDVEKALKKLPEYKKKYSELVDANSKKSEFYVKYVPEFFKLNDDATPDEILYCYINWWISNVVFGRLGGDYIKSSNGEEENRLHGSTAIVRIFGPSEKCSYISSRTVIKAKEDADFLKEYAEKEKILEEREKALELKEKQYVEEKLSVFGQKFDSTGSAVALY